jgi:hypothetical protein
VPLADATVRILLSRASLARSKGHQDEELTLAIDQMHLRRRDEQWLIPVRFDECPIPERDIGRGRTLTSIQRADLFGDGFDDDAARLTEAVRRILIRQAALSWTSARRARRP